MVRWIGWSDGLPVFQIFNDSDARAKLLEGAKTFSANPELMALLSPDLQFVIGALIVELSSEMVFDADTPFVERVKVTVEDRS